MIVPHAGHVAMDDDMPVSATDLARAWESCSSLRRKGLDLQLVLGMHAVLCIKYSMCIDHAL